MLMVLLFIWHLKYLETSACAFMPLMRAPFQQWTVELDVASANYNAKGYVVMLKFVAETIWQDLFKDNVAVPL